jgi:hypothetical protein
MGMIPYEEYQFGNKTFFLNAIEYLNEPSGLLESRSKQVVLRLLNKEKVEERRLFWQIILVMGPIAILLLIFLAWTKYRSAQFAD